MINKEDVIEGLAEQQKKEFEAMQLLLNCVGSDIVDQAQLKDDISICDTKIQLYDDAITLIKG